MLKNPSVKRFVKICSLLLFVSALTWITVYANDGGSQPAVPADTAAAGAPGAAPQQPGFMAMAFPFIAMFGVFYFLMVRPQQKKMREHQRLLGDLKKGDEVVTASGFLGTIYGIADKVVTLDLGGNCKVKVLKSQISQLQSSSGTLKDLST